MTTGVTVDFNANLARFTTSVEKATADLGKFQSKAESVSANIRSTFAGLAAGLTVGSIVAYGKSIIDAQDRMNDLRLTTNLTIETLSGLKFAAGVSGGDLESAAESINKLAVNMGKNSEKFKALGITAKDPLEAFKQLSDIFVAVQDPQLRAALGAEALAKKWQGAAPLLMEGSKGIGELVEKGARLSGVTAESAEAADKFNDKWRELFGTGQLVNTVVGEALPLFNALADEMITARDKSEGLNSGFKPLLETGKAVVVTFSEVSFAFQTIGKDIARAFENVQLIAKGDWAGSRALGALFKQDAKDARQALDEWQKKILDIGKSAAAASAKVPKKRDADLEERVSEFVDPAKTARAAKHVKSAEDYALRIQEAVAGAVNNSAIVKSRELADQIASLDSLFFDSSLDADIYTSALERLANMTASVSDQEAQLARLLEATPTAQLEKTREEMQLLADALGNFRITEEQFNEAVLTRLGQTGTAIDEMTEFVRQAARNMQDAMADGFFDIMQGRFDRLGSSFKATLDRMVANAIAADLSNKLFGDFGKSGKLGGWAGDWLGKLFAPGYGDAAGVAAGVPAYAEGTSYVPRTGLAIVHQGERIIPADQNRGGFGGTIIIHVNGAGNAQDVRRAAGQGAREALAAFAGAQRYA